MMMTSKTFLLGLALASAATAQQISNPELALFAPPATCQDDMTWRDRDGDSCYAYRNHPNGAAWACNSFSYEDSKYYCRQTCGTCTGSPAPLLPTMGRCSQNYGCYNCLLQPGCLFDTNSNTCKEESDCNFVAKAARGGAAMFALQDSRSQVCLQNVDQCVVDSFGGSCSRNTNQWSCENQLGFDCAWNAWTRQCATRLEVNNREGASCGTIYSERTCDNTWGCRYNWRNRLCESNTAPAPKDPINSNSFCFYSYNSAGPCNQDYRCQWYGAKQRCMDR